jgi:hypothetical protein
VTDPLDQPEEHGLSLVMPFVVVDSAGGPYDDLAFTAGYACGLVDANLCVAAEVGAYVVLAPMVRADLLPQLELIGMRHGFPSVEVSTTDEYPQWVDVTFRRPHHGCPVAEPS